MKKTSPAASVIALADLYANELETQYRRLNSFVRHPGEIGRAHEAYLKAVIGKYMPAKFRLGTGFVAWKDGVSHQKDILIHNAADYPTMFEVGECVVVDLKALVATVEVKTVLRKRDFFDGFEQASGPIMPFSGLFAWDGYRTEKAEETFVKYVRAGDVRARVGLRPTAVLVLRRYLWIRRDTGVAGEESYQVFTIGKTGISNGTALLIFLWAMWHYGFGTSLSDIDRPWWLDGAVEGHLGRARLLKWPGDIHAKLVEHVAPPSGAPASP